MYCYLYISVVLYGNNKNWILLLALPQIITKSCKSSSCQIRWEKLQLLYVKFVRFKISHVNFKDNKSIQFSKRIFSCSKSIFGIDLFDEEKFSKDKSKYRKEEIMWKYMRGKDLFDQSLFNEEWFDENLSKYEKKILRRRYERKWLAQIKK